MGNTNIPQFGAEGTANSRDTRVGEQQLTDQQKRRRDAEAEGGLSALLPDSTANESHRVVDHADHGENVIGKHVGDGRTTSSVKREADVAPTEADRVALAGHVDTGHSPSDAT